MSLGPADNRAVIVVDAGLARSVTTAVTTMTNTLSLGNPVLSETLTEPGFPINGVTLGNLGPSKLLVRASCNTAVFGRFNIWAHDGASSSALGTTIRGRDTTNIYIRPDGKSCAGRLLLTDKAGPMAQITAPLGDLVSHSGIASSWFDGTTSYGPAPTVKGSTISKYNGWCLTRPTLYNPFGTGGALTVQSVSASSQIVSSATDRCFLLDSGPFRFSQVTGLTNYYQFTYEVEVPNRFDLWSEAFCGWSALHFTVNLVADGYDFQPGSQLELHILPLAKTQAKSYAAMDMTRVYAADSIPIINTIPITISLPTGMPSMPVAINTSVPISISNGVVSIAPGSSAMDVNVTNASLKVKGDGAGPPVQVCGSAGNYPRLPVTSERVNALGVKMIEPLCVSSRPCQEWVQGYYLPEVDRPFPLVVTSDIPLPSTPGGNISGEPTARPVRTVLTSSAGGALDVRVTEMPDVPVSVEQSAGSTFNVRTTADSRVLIDVPNDQSNPLWVTKTDQTPTY